MDRAVPPDRRTTVSPDGAPEIRGIFPTTSPITIAEAYAAERPHPADRPWLALCMISSLDGAVAVDGTSGALGNRNDFEILLTMREQADVILVGAGTSAAEGYGPPRRAGQRIGVVTNSGRVDLETELFRSGAGFVVTAEETAIDTTRVDVVRAGGRTVDAAMMMQRLHQVVDPVDVVLAEGGPRLNGSLLDAGLVDEVVLTIAPRLVGGDSPRLTAGAAAHFTGYALAHLLVDEDGYVFGRWVRSPAARTDRPA